MPGELSSRGRIVLIAVAAMGLMGFIGLLVAPGFVSDLFGISDFGAEGHFMVRRYGASGALGMAVGAGALLVVRPPVQAMALAAVAWLTVQGLVALVSVAGGTISGFGWMVAPLDLTIAAAIAATARKLGA